MSDQPPTAAAAKPRLVYLDRLRVLGMLDIVSIHSTGQYLFGGVGLPIFLITSVAVNVRKPVPPTVKEVAHRRARTILKPWLFWSLAYLPVIAWEEVRHGRSPWGAIEPAMILFGPAIHLWFLPFILPANIAAVYLARRSLGIPTVRVIQAAAWIGAATLLLAAFIRFRWGVGPPFGQWLFSIPAVPLGLAVGRCIAMGARRKRLLAGLALVAVAVTAAGVWGGKEPVLEWWLLRRYGIALALISVASMWAEGTDRITQLLARNTLGIYLVHPMLLMIGGWFGLGTKSLLGQTLLVYSCSLAFVLLLRRTRLTTLV
jgi:surface polysaccharide O-acyltransferase-like enzyme